MAYYRNLFTMTHEHPVSIFGAVFLAVLVPVTCRGLEPTPDAVTSRQGMVVSVSEPASRVGAAVIERGGNAVDAAVATAFALAVTYPAAGNIGGGGFMMILPAPNTEPVCIDYRETAPAAATARMFSLGDSRLSAKMVGVPGTVRGLALAHEEYGQLEWRSLVRPAIRLARDGFTVDQPLAKSLNGVLRSKRSGQFPEMLRVFAPPEGDQWRAGDRLVQPDLGATLARIAREGPDGFYGGPVAKALIDALQVRRGIMSLSDLADYRAKIRRPIHGTFRDHDIHGPPPPSSGGIVLVQMLNVLENFDLRQLGHGTAAASHLTIEAMRRGFLDRARYLGDQDYVDIPPHLTSKSYARNVASQIDRQEASSSADLAPDIRLAPEGSSTTHFSVVDETGMAVSNTYTLEQSYGSRIMVRGRGFLLNNEMGDFNWVPDHTDRKGRIGTKPNLVAPGKRMLSSQTPVIVMKDGKPRLLVGSPGGRTIINTVLCVVLNVLEFQMDLPEAVAAPRWHHQWLPDVTRFEGADKPAYADLVAELKAMGHNIAAEGRRQGDAHCILVDPDTGTATGVADGRRSGKAVAAGLAE